MLKLRNITQLAWFALLASAIALGSAPVGDGVADDTNAINGLLQATAGSCATVQLQGTKGNKFKVSNSINVPKCVKFVGVLGGIPDEGSSTTIGTTLLWAGSGTTPVVYFHDSPGAYMTGVSVDCNNVANTIGVQYDSDDNPAGSFVNIDTLMIKGCHQALVVGLPAATPQQTVQQCQNMQTLGCYQADQLKFERYRILGNLGDPTGEGIHINSANAAQGSLIADGNIQGVNLGIHIIMTNGGLVIQSSNIGSVVGANPAFLQVESNVVASPTLINDEVEGSGISAVVDHSCNPSGTPGTPVWVGNNWNAHPVVVDGCESVTSIGNLSTSANVNNKSAHILSLNEGGWSLGSGVSPASLSNLSVGTATFGDSLIDRNVIAAEGPLCPGFPSTVQSGDLIACEGSHAGRLYLGGDLMLMNDGNGTLDTEGLIRIQTGLHQDGSGLKHQTVSTGSITAAGTTSLALTWTTPFADANYQAVCSVQDGSGSLQVLSTSPPAASSVSVFVKNNDTANAHVGTLACFAMHN